MNDDFIHELRGTWQSQDHDVANALRRVRRHRWMPHLILALEISSCVVAWLVGMWFAWMAGHAEVHRLLFALSAAAMLISAPAFAIASFMARRRSLAWDAESPEALLRVGVCRAESSLRAIRVGYWHIAIITAFVVALWIAQALGFIDAIEFLMFYTALCGVMCSVSWLWMARRTKQLRSDHAAYLDLLTKFQADAESA
jgi:hypothetical protein